MHNGGDIASGVDVVVDVWCCVGRDGEVGDVGGYP